MKQGLTIGTFNTRYAEADDGLNSWNNRKNLILERISKVSPDIIGFQEVLPHVKDFFHRELHDYLIVGNGRTEDYKGEYNCIAFKKDLFELISLETIWLSHTPHRPGSQLENNDTCPRICTAATLRFKDDKGLFRVFNTHLDYRFPNIRLEQLSILDDFIKGYEAKTSLPTFITGDLNCTPDSKEIDLILNKFEVGFKDISTEGKIGKDYTFHDFYYGREDKVKIDYIFGTKDIDLIDAFVDDTERDGIYLSDHYPIYCLVEI